MWSILRQLLQKNNKICKHLYLLTSICINLYVNTHTHIYIEWNSINIVFTESCWLMLHVIAQTSNAGNSHKASDSLIYYKCETLKPEVQLVETWFQNPPGVTLLKKSAPFDFCICMLTQQHCVCSLWGVLSIIGTEIWLYVNTTAQGVIFLVVLKRSKQRILP